MGPRDLAVLSVLKGVTFVTLQRLSVTPVQSDTTWTLPTSAQSVLITAYSANLPQTAPNALPGMTAFSTKTDNKNVSSYGGNGSLSSLEPF